MNRGTNNFSEQGCEHHASPPRARLATPPASAIVVLPDTDERIELWTITSNAPWTRHSHLSQPPSIGAWHCPFTLFGNSKAVCPAFATGFGNGYCAGPKRLKETIRPRQLNFEQVSRNWRIVGCSKTDILRHRPALLIFFSCDSLQCSSADLLPHDLAQTGFLFGGERRPHAAASVSLGIQACMTTSPSVSRSIAAATSRVGRTSPRRNRLMSVRSFPMRRANSASPI